MEGGIICRSGARYVLTIKREGDWRAVLAGRKICNARTPLETELYSELGVTDDGQSKTPFPVRRPSTLLGTPYLGVNRASGKVLLSYLLEHVSMVGSVSKSEPSSQVQLPC